MCVVRYAFEKKKKDVCVVSPLCASLCSVCEYMSVVCVGGGVWCVVEIGF